MILRGAQDADNDDGDGVDDDGDAADLLRLKCTLSARLVCS